MSRDEKKLWSMSLSLGRYTVRIYEPRPGGNLMRSIYLGGKENRKSLGHKDKERAEHDVQTLLEHLQEERTAMEEGTLTLGMLADLYLSSEAHTNPTQKAERTREEDRKKIERIVAFWGPNLRVKALSKERVLKYSRARRSGDPSLLHTRARQAARRREKDAAEGDSVAARRRERQRKDEMCEAEAVGARAVEADLVALQTMLNWATTERDDAGERLIPENPLKGVSLEGERNPRQPVVSHDGFLRLLEVADEVDPLLRAALIIAEATGRRLSAWRQLRWEDIDWAAEPFGRVHWRADTDKNGTAQIAPITLEVRKVLLELWQSRKGDSPWVFPSPNKPSAPCGRHLLDDWLRRAYELARVPQSRGEAWHALRRKWATERKQYPVKDLAAAGGWKTVDMVLRYTQVDQETLDNIILNPSQRLRGSARPEDSQQTHNGQG